MNDSDGAALKYPLHFDLRVIYALAENADPEPELRAALIRSGAHVTLVQGIIKPGAKYGRIGARVCIDSKAIMDAAYANVAAIPGVKTVL